MKIPSILTSFTTPENVRAIVRPHWIMLVPVVLLFAWAALLFYGTLSTFQSSTSAAAHFFMAPAFFTLIGVALGIQAILSGTIRAVGYYFSYLLITDTHAITLTGIARQIRSMEIEDSDIRGVDESLVGRVLGYGVLNVSGFSGATIARFPVANPYQLLEQMGEA